MKLRTMILEAHRVWTRRDRRGPCVADDWSTSLEWRMTYLTYLSCNMERMLGRILCSFTNK